MQDRFGDKIRLQHIIDAINEIETYTKDVTPEIFASNSMMFNATLRQLEIIGEASNKLLENLIEENEDIAWGRIIGLRNLVIHEYFGIDDLAIWNIIKINIPTFKDKIIEILNARRFY